MARMKKKNSVHLKNLIFSVLKFMRIASC